MPPNETPEPAPRPQDAPQPPAPPLIPASPSPSVQEEPPDPLKWFQRCIYRRFGLRGWLIVAILFFIVPWVWSNWSTVKELPVVSTIVTWFSPLPKADPQRFAVALAHLEHDKEQQAEEIILNVLKGFEGVQLLLFDRTISLRGTKPEESEKKGHAQAQQYLKDSGAHVLIWGLVLSHDGKSAPHLYWTTEQESRRAKEPYQPENFKLPELFWNDLQDVLRLVVATHHSTFLAHRGHFTAKQLAPFIAKVQHLLGPRTGQQNWSKVQFFLGNALLMLGEQIGTIKPLEDAVTTYQAILTVWPQKSVSLDWAMIQNNLGYALRRLGERELRTTRLEEAIAAHEATLSVWTQEHNPLDWAMAQDNLGNALHSLGRREPGTARLEKAVAAYQDALKERTRKRRPLDWAATQNNLGNALRSLGNALLQLGNWGPGMDALEKAVAAHKAALEERTRERGPLDWAIMQNNLGAALHTLGNALLQLGNWEPGMDALEKAFAAFQDALKERAREHVPRYWAETQGNLSLLLWDLGKQKRDITLICEALGKLLMAWEVFSIGSPYDTAKAENLARNVLASLKNTFDFSTYEACVAKHMEALKRIGLQ